MGTIAEKLNYTLDAKSSIKNSIINKGVAMPDATPLGEYGSYIDSIQTGGGSGGGDTPAIDLCDDIEEHIWVDTNNVIYVNDILLSSDTKTAPTLVLGSLDLALTT